MASITFSTGVVIPSTWLNDINSAIYVGLGGNTTVAGIKSFLGIFPNTVTSPSTGQKLQYNGTTWINVADNLDSLNDVTVTAPSTTQLLKYNGTTWINANSNLIEQADVLITNPVNNQILYYETASGKWKNGSLTTDVSQDVLFWMST